MNNMSDIIHGLHPVTVILNCSLLFLAVINWVHCSCTDIQQIQLEICPELDLVRCPWKGWIPVLWDPWPKSCKSRNSYDKTSIIVCVPLTRLNKKKQKCSWCVAQQQILPETDNAVSLKSAELLAVIHLELYVEQL